MGSEGAEGHEEKPEGGLTARQAYNIVSDTVTVPNTRTRDNLLQGSAILACVVADATAGAFLGGLRDWTAGLLTSCIFLMLSRFVMHICGRHDQATPVPRVPIASHLLVSQSLREGRTPPVTHDCAA